MDKICTLIGSRPTNTKQKAENERMKKAFAEAVKKRAEERTKALTAEKQKAERDRALEQSRSLAIEKDKAVWQLQEQQVNEQQHIRQAVSQVTAEKDDWKIKNGQGIGI